MDKRIKESKTSKSAHSKRFSISRDYPFDKVKDINNSSMDWSRQWPLISNTGLYWKSFYVNKTSIATDKYTYQPPSTRAALKEAVDKRRFYLNARKAVNIPEYHM